VFRTLKYTLSVTRNRTDDASEHQLATIL